MKLIGSSGKHSKPASKPKAAPAAETRPKPSPKPKAKEPAVDEAYWDDILADILGTNSTPAKPAAKKPSTAAKTASPAKTGGTAKAKPATAAKPKPAAPAKPRTSAAPATSAKPAAPAKPRTSAAQAAPAKPAAPAKKAEPHRKPETEVKKKAPEAERPPVKKETPVKKKDPVASEIAGLYFDDGWDSVFDKPKKKKNYSEEELFDPEKSNKEKRKKAQHDADRKTEKKNRKAEKKQRKAEKSEAVYNPDETAGDGDELIEVDSRSRKKRKKKRSPLRRLIRFIITLLVLASLYLFFVYTKVPFVASLRDAYIETAMSTMSHQWMAEWFFPQSVIDEVVNRVEHATQSQEGKVSDWDKKKDEKEEEKDKDTINTEEDFYKAFWELDPNTVEDYMNDHPEALANGWGNIYINEAGLEDSGTSMWTKMDEQVLALDVPNRLLLVRVKGSGYQGVLAIAKDSSRLSCTPAANIGSYGERLEDIMNRTGAVLGMTGSGFIDEGGNGNGGSIVGFALCEGTELGTKVGYPYKRIELREDNLLYIVDSESAVDAKTTDAVEFAPALIVDGESLIDQLSGYTSINPRACIGQSDKGELLMLVIEGRLPSRSFGCGLPECTEILIRHNAYQAMNLDGGTSAIMWYNGEYVTKCSNTAITCRTLPNAWIYSKQPVQ